MTKQFYIQTDETGKVTDLIEYPFDGYLPIVLNVPLPPKVISGCYKLFQESLIYVPEWDRENQLDSLVRELGIDSLKAKISELEAFQTAITGGTTE